MLLFGDSEGVPDFKGFSFKDETFRLIVGILAILVGLLKLLSPADDTPIIGDLVPALAGFISGFILIFEYYRNRATLETTEKAEKIDRLLVSNKKIIAIATIVAAALHFFFPGALLL